MWTSFAKYLLGSVLLVTLYQNCSATHESDSSLSSFDACNIGLMEEFRTGYHEFLQTNCATCHVNAGSGNGAFADGDLNLAFDAFNVRGATLVGGRALDSNHQPPYSGPQHQSEIDRLDATWATAKEQADLCVANAGVTIDPGIDTGIVSDDVQPTSGTIETFIKLLDADKDERVITWNLENEIKDPAGLSYVGATFSMRVQALTTVTGDKSYVFSDPVLTTGNDPLHFQYIGVKINNRLVQEATSFNQINRRVPANSTRRLGFSGMIFGYDVRATDTVSIMIGNLEIINFAPPTFNDLAGAGGIFNVNCNSCHSGANPRAGLDMTDYGMITSFLMVSPYNPNNSEIFIRMNDNASPMPQDTGLLPQADRDQVLDWIRDGATECGFNNNGDVQTNCP